MKRNKIIGIIIFLLLILLAIVIVLAILVQKNKDLNSSNNINIDVITKSSTIEDVLEKYDSELIEKEKKYVYVSFEKDLFDESGNSNENYFKSIVEDVTPFFENTFYLIDEEKNINIYVNIQEESIIFNNNEDFYDEIDGKAFANIENVRIAPKEVMYIKSEELSDIAFNGMFFTKAVAEELGEEDEEQKIEGYTTYQNGSIKISKYKYSNRIRNMIFSKDYNNQIISGIDKDDTLEEINNKLENVAFGSVNKGYLGYRNDDVYMFFYEDEISIYGYSYKQQSNLENYIKEYFEKRDLDKFHKSMIMIYDNFYEYKYDKENMDLYLSYPSLGLEIDIHNNDIKGITLYNNYFFTERSKNWVKEGLIKLEANTDYIEKTEKERVSKEKGE